MTLSLKKDVELPAKSDKQKTRKIYFYCHLEGHWKKEKDPGPDP